MISLPSVLSTPDASATELDTSLVGYNTRASDLGPLRAAARLVSCEDSSQRLISHSELSLRPVPSGLNSPLFIRPPSNGTIIFFAYAVWHVDY